MATIRCANGNHRLSKPLGQYIIMKDIRDKQAKWYGISLLILAPLIFIYTYIETTLYLQQFGTEKLVWDIMKDITPDLLITLTIGLGLLKLGPLIKTKKVWPEGLWALFTVLSLSGNVLSMFIQFHIISLIKTIVLSVFIYTILKHEKEDLTKRSTE